MSFIEKQRHGKRVYYYAVKNVRVTPTKIKKLRIFIGQKLPAESGLEKYFVELEKAALSKYQSKWLAGRLVEKIDDLSASITVFHKQTDGSPIPISKWMYVD